MKFKWIEDLNCDAFITKLDHRDGERKNKAFNIYSHVKQISISNYYVGYFRVLLFITNKDYF